MAHLPRPTRGQDLPGPEPVTWETAGPKPAMGSLGVGGLGPEEGSEE